MSGITIATLPALAIVGIPHVGPYSDLGTAFDRLIAWATAKDTLRPGVRFFAVGWDNPDFVPADKLRSLAGMTLPEGVVPDDGVTRLILAAGRYAQTIHKGPYDELPDTYRRIISQWLPQSGEAMAEEPCYEEYLNDCRSLPSSEWLTRINVPLR